jgi:hypothetical protein
MVNESKYLLILWIQSLEFWCDNEQSLVHILCGYKLKKFKKGTCYVSYMKCQFNFMLINVMKNYMELDFKHACVMLNTPNTSLLACSPYKGCIQHSNV